MKEKSKTTFKYIIKLDSKTIVEVNQEQLFTKTRWLEHFGSIENIEKFINEYNAKNEHKIC